MAEGKSWLAYLSQLGGGLATLLGGGAISYSQALSSIPKPPPHPNLPNLLHWILTGDDTAAKIAALASGAGLIATIYPLLGPKPYSRQDGAADRAHQNASFEALDRRGQDGFAELAAGQVRIEAQLAKIATGIPDPQQAANFKATGTELAGSDDSFDRAIAREIVQQSPEIAADTLVADAQTGKRRNAERFRQAARLYAPFAPGKAREAYEEAVALDPADLWSWIELGRLRAQYTTLAHARRCFQSALQQVEDDWGRMVLHNEFGNVLRAEGHLVEAGLEYASGMAIAQRLADADPANAGWQRDLFVSHFKLAALATEKGDPDAAADSFRAAETIIARLVEQRPDHPGFARDLATVRDAITHLSD